MPRDFRLRPKCGSVKLKDKQSAAVPFFGFLDDLKLPGPAGLGVHQLIVEVVLA